MASSNKKVIVRLEDGTVQAGYLPGSRIVRRETAVLDLLDVAGRIVPVALKTVRYIAYVRDFNLNDRSAPERLMRKTFIGRPRTEGLWLRLTFRDGDVLEGLAAIDITLLDEAIADEGIYLIPPDVRSNTQRLFVPRHAIATLAVLSVVTSPSKATARAIAQEPTLPFPDR
jgi:hypothetical protein